MLLRAALSVREREESERLARILRRLSVWVEPVDVLALDPVSVGHAYDLVLTGPRMTADRIREVLAAARLGEEPPAVIRLYREADPEAQASLLGHGLADSIWVDLDDDAMFRALSTVVDRRRAEIEASLGRRTEEPGLRDFRSLSPHMRRFQATVRTVAATDTTLLVLGETGVGKEWLARAVHQESGRREGPFVPVNCGALSETLLESELFGHERGAFTGADRPRRGHFELAHGGTLFLDEIGEMPLHLQSRLLRVLEDRKVQRLGSERVARVDVRIIAATHRDLSEDVHRGRFRADLFYRLRVVHLTIPPLRERREDIPSLARFHVLAAAQRIGLSPVELTEEALEALSGYPWPGNVRELANVVERAVILSRGEPIRVSDLPEEIQKSARSTQDGSIGLAKVPKQLEAHHREEEASDRALPVTPSGVFASEIEESSEWEKPWKDVRQLVLDRVEKVYFERVMARAEGKVGEAARLAGLSERGLFEKLKRHGISKDSFRTKRAS